MKQRAWLVAALIAVTACGEPPAKESRHAVAASATAAPAPPPAPPPKPVTDWHLRLETYGGFASAGKGWIDIGSDHAASSDDCKAAALPDEAVNQTVLAATPDKWVGCYQHASFRGRTDQFSYQLRLRIEREGEDPIRYRVSWRDDSAGMLPADLSRIAAAAWRVHNQLETRCTPRERSNAGEPRVGADHQERLPHPLES